MAIINLMYVIQGISWQSEHCGKSLLNGFYLKKHLVFNHGIKEGAFICDRCPKTIFSTEIALKKHVKEKHKNVE